MRFFCILLCLPLVILAACESLPEYQDGAAADAFLVESISSIDAQRQNEILSFPSDSLVNYLNNYAAYYTRMGCRELATAEYMLDSILLEVDVYRFDSTENAFGVYIAMRIQNYSDSTIVDFGYQGFTEPTGLTFVKGSYLVRFMSFNDSEKDITAMNRLAGYFSRVIPGETVKPAGFALLPEQDAVPGGEMYYPRSFLGFEFFPPVYYKNYVRGDDSLDVFLVIDSAGATLLQMSKAVEEAGAMTALPESISFDDGKGFIYSHPQYGYMLCGIKGEYLVLFFGYAESKDAFIVDWISRL